MRIISATLKNKKERKMMSIQNQLHEAELILKTVLENEASTSRAYLKALVITYFDTKKIKERKVK